MGYSTKDVCCGFTKVVELHHIDGNKENRSDKNLVGLCPNCHKMIHSYKYFEGMKKKLKRRGYDTLRASPSQEKGGKV